MIVVRDKEAQGRQFLVTCDNGFRIGTIRQIESGLCKGAYTFSAIYGSQFSAERLGRIADEMRRAERLGDSYRGGGIQTCSMSHPSPPHDKSL